MELSLGGIIVHEADVAVTDWLLAAECLLFAGLLLKAKASGIRTLCVALFLSLAAASVLGGAYHAFFPLKTATAEGWAIWMGTMLSIGITSVLLLALSAQLAKPAWARQAFIAGMLLFTAYAYWVLAIDHQFRIAILFYGPALLLFMTSLLARFVRTKDLGLMPGIDSVVLMLIAAWAQQAGIGLHPVYFNHNALYHVLQGAALLLLFVTFRRQLRRS